MRTLMPRWIGCGSDSGFAGDILMALEQPAGLVGFAAWHALLFDVACRVLVISAHGKVLSVNQGALEYFGLAHDQIVNQQLTDLYPAEIREHVSAWLSRALNNDPIGQTPVHEHHIFRGHHWAMRGRRTTWEDGQPCVLCVGQVVDQPTPLPQLLQRATRLSDRTAALGELAVLSDRELEVAMLISGGLTDSEVAKSLHRSLRTVHSHRLTIGRKMGLKRRSEVATMMVQRGLVACMPEHVKPVTSFLIVTNGVVDRAKQPPPMPARGAAPQLKR